MIDKLETMKQEEKRIEQDRLSIAKYNTEDKVPRNGTFFSFKIITLKELQEKNNQPLRIKL